MLLLLGFRSMFLIGLQDYSQRKLSDVVRLWENSAESEAILLAHKLYLARFNLSGETNASLSCATPNAATPFAATPPVWGSGANVRAASMRSEASTMRAVARQTSFETSTAVKGSQPSASPNKALVRLNVRMIADIAEAIALESHQLLAEDLEVLNIVGKRVRALVQQAQMASAQGAGSPDVGGDGIFEGEAHLQSMVNSGEAGTASLPSSGSSSGDSAGANPHKIGVSTLDPDLISMDKWL
jgi:hypothetical protein